MQIKVTAHATLIGALEDIEYWDRTELLDFKVIIIVSS